jgi:predicted dehydrogenase
MACARKLDILSEKPIAATWEDCCAIYRTVKNSGVRMMVTQNYRFSPRILTLKKAVAQIGAVNYVVARYAVDYRIRNTWESAFRHEIPHTLLVEGGIHHLDQIRNLTGENIRTIAGYEWNPDASRGGTERFAGSDSFDGEPCGLYVIEMGSAFANYEGNNVATGKQNGWSGEYYRVECEGGAAILDSDDIVRIEERDMADGPCGETRMREISLETPQWSGHQAIAAQFVEWLEGGAVPATFFSDNIQSNAALFAAIDASTRRETIDVQKMLRDALGEI